MTTEHSIETFEADVLVERREFDLATLTFTRRDGVGNVIETRSLTARETVQLNDKASRAAANAAFAQAQAAADALPGNSTTKQILITVLDELARVRGDGA